MSDLGYLLADLGRVLVVMAAVAALGCALAWPEPLWTITAVLTVCAAVMVSRQPSLGSVRGISSLDAGGHTPASSGPPHTQ